MFQVGQYPDFFDSCYCHRDLNQARQNQFRSRFEILFNPQINRRQLFLGLAPDLLYIGFVELVTFPLELGYFLIGLL